jgi:hypothetical protein
MVAIGALAVAWACGLAADVPAATVVSGDRDTNAPLVIDPSTSPTGESTVQLAPGPVMFIERMPVTKRVDRVTLGDLSLPPGCANVTANAKISEHQTRDMNTSSAQFYSLSSVSLPASPSKLTWTFSPVTMRKGYGYSFSVSLSGCPQYRQTTWAHNQSQVDPGLLRCTQGPNVNRMWHEAGQEDGQSGCVDPSPSTRKFNSIMPSGWLVSVPAQNGSNVWDVMSFSGQPPVCYTPYYPNKYETYGAEPIAWRADPFGQTDYTCRWTQFAAFNTPAENLPSDGWYYAQPWLPSPNQAPRDMYLKLETIDYDALLQAYAPVLKFDQDEQFYPQAVGAMTDFYETPPSGYAVDNDYVNTLHDQNGDVLAAAGSPGSGGFPPALQLGLLGAGYGSGLGPSSTGDWLDARGSTPLQYQTDAVSMYSLGYDDVTYGRVLHDPDDGRLWLQYWFFYYFNSYEVSGLGYHEGDWEMVQIGLANGGSPELMTFAVHGYAFKAPWSDVEKDSVSGAPHVYVAARSHASYPESGTSAIDVPQWVDPTDHHRGDDFAQRSPVTEMTTGLAWTEWLGRWGASTSGSFTSPPSPSQQGDRWDAPSAFNAGAREW